MRLLFVADGRSPIALNWIGYFVNRGHEVHLVSSFDCVPNLELASLHIVPVAFSGLKHGGTLRKDSGASSQRYAWGLAVGVRTRIRQWVGPLTLPGAGRRLRVVIERIRPDLVHAMRIPYEGMLAALASPQAPLLVSVWGNDFTLHAPSTPWMQRNTHLTLSRASALHTDCYRDLRLARDWGFDPDKPFVVLPGAGGIQLDIFYPPARGLGADPERERTVINPRGFRAYVRNDVFFQAIPIVLKTHPDTRFICPMMADESQAHRWAAELGVEGNVHLLPRQTRSQMAGLFRQARLAISPSTHDGTPNTLLEAMACGCLPVAGDLESIREWVTPQQNGLLFDPTDPQSVAQAILSGFKDDALCQRARDYNWELIIKRAAYSTVMEAAEQFYERLISS